MNTIAISPIGFRNTPVSGIHPIRQAIRRVGKSGIPSAVKTLILSGLFSLGTLAGVWGAELRTSAGVDHQSRVMFDTASNATGSYAAANYVALTENSTAPALGDTTLSSELVGEGLSRAQATYAHTNGTTTTALTKTFTMSSGTSRTINKAGLFNASSTGTLTFTTLVPSPPTLVPGDSVAVTWTFTF